MLGLLDNVVMTMLWGITVVALIGAVIMMWGKYDRERISSANPDLPGENEHCEE